MIQKRSEANKDELKRRDYVRQLIASKNRIRELMTVMPVRREVSYELFQVFENGEPSGEAIPAQELLNIDTVGLSHVILKQGGVYGDLVKDIE